MTSVRPAEHDPGWRPRLVALDIDGTLVDHDGVLPAAIGRRGRGWSLAPACPVVLATGRAWHGTRPVFELLGLPPGPAVCSNGAVVVSLPAAGDRPGDHLRPAAR